MQKGECSCIGASRYRGEPIYNVTFDNVDVDKAGIGLGFSNTKTIGVSNCNLGGYVGVPSTASAKDGIFDK